MRNDARCPPPPSHPQACVRVVYHEANISEVKEKIVRVVFKYMSKSLLIERGGDGGSNTFPLTP
jgi:hypothetical protein